MNKTNTGENFLSNWMRDPFPSVLRGFGVLDGCPLPDPVESLVPQFLQKKDPGGFCTPHLGQ